MIEIIFAEHQQIERCRLLCPLLCPLWLCRRYFRLRRHANFRYRCLFYPCLSLTFSSFCPCSRHPHFDRSWLLQGRAVLCFFLFFAVTIMTKIMIAKTIPDSADTSFVANSVMLKSRYNILLLYNLTIICQLYLSKCAV